MNTKFNLHFKRRVGNRIVGRISYQGGRVDIYLNMTAEEKEWNEKKECYKQGVMVNGVPYNLLNKQLDDVRSYVSDYFSGCFYRGVEPSLTELKAHFNAQFKMSGAKRSNEFYSVFDEFVKEQTQVKGWQKSMVEAYMRLQELCKGIDNNLSFGRLTTDFMTKLTDSLCATMLNEAVKKRISYFKSFCKWAKAKHYPVNDDCLNYAPTLHQGSKEVRYLNYEEIKKIWQLRLPFGGYLDKVRDYFVFQTQTGLRDSDVRLIKKGDISAEGGKLYLDIMTKKNKKRIKFPLTKIAEEIYNKYSNWPQPMADDRLFPKISNQKYNNYLKELGKKAEIKGEYKDIQMRGTQRTEVITPRSDIASHDARRSFIVAAISNGASTEQIMEITGHSNYSSMKPYIALADNGAEAVIECIDKINDEAEGNK